MVLVAWLHIVASMLGAASVAPGREARPAPRVFVYTVETKDVVKNEEERGRLDSVRDVRDALGRSSKVVLVPDATTAQVLVEVVGREKRDGSLGGFGGTVVTPPIETIVRLRVTFGDHETEIKGVAQGYWGRAAKDAAERLVKWITRNAATPGSGRSTSQGPSRAF